MKKNNLMEVKKMNIKEIWEKIKKAEGELIGLRFDKNAGKLTNVKALSTKKNELAQMKTILNQKRLLERLEKKNG